METYFNLRYEFDKEAVMGAIDGRLRQEGADYICVADGVILNTANRHPDYMEVVNGGMFCICDSGYVPLYIRCIHGRRLKQYTGSEIFMDVIRARRYRMAFLGTQQVILDGLKEELAKVNPDVEGMMFVELPFRKVEDFDYPAIAQMVNDDGADIIWIALGAPKQEIFMSRLKPYLRRGVMLGVGAAFKFYSSESVSRAPRWMVEHHMEFLHRIYKEPKKQLRRCSLIMATLPRLLYDEWQRKRQAQLITNYE